MTPVTGIAYSAASLAISVVLFLGSRYHHKETLGTSVYRLPPTYSWFFILFALVAAIFALVSFVVPAKDGLWQVGILAAAVAPFLMLFGWWLSRMRVIIATASIVYRGFKIRQIRFADVVKIVKDTRDRREPRVCIYTSARRKLIIDGLVTDFDQMVSELHIKCPRAEYVEKK